MSSVTKGSIIHTVASMAGISVAFSFIPQPWGTFVATVWGGIVALAAFFDTTASKTTV